MKKLKRLFLFAGFDKDNIVDDTVVYYVNALSKFGDVVFVMDNDLPKNQLEKISKMPHVLYANGMRHGEYDFGSYKRAYLWAKQNKILDDYDWLYLVNDSVYGPLWDLTNVLDNLENSDADLVGMTANCDKCTPEHVQSWFVGCAHKVFASDFFDKFMCKITRIPNKTALVLKYEVGLSWMIVRRGFKMKTLVNAKDNNIYQEPCSILVKGVPFVKKNGAANLRKLYFLNPHIEDDVYLDYMVAHMQRHNVKLQDILRNVYDLRLFGIPLLRVSVKGSSGAYKVYLFNCIPILKITK
jgi:lipopolysaccharide biosynthesis protein